MAARHRRAAGTPRLRPCHVRLHLLPFLQSRARQHLVRRDGDVALVPHLVVENSVVNFALYAAAATHAGLGLWALYQRRHFRYTAAEITQLALGLSIPLLIASHLGAERGSGLLFGPIRRIMQRHCSSIGWRVRT